jgi:hypothetical protein
MFARTLLIATLVSLSTAASASAQETTYKPLAKGETGSTGYPSVAAALQALRATSNVNVSVQGGWTIVDDREHSAIWSFTPPSHPAHPAAVKRVIVQKEGDIHLQMSVLCQAEKAACDKLVAEFQALNDKMRESLHRKSDR